MNNKAFSLLVKAALAVLPMTLLATSAVAANHKVLHSFGDSPDDGTGPTGALIFDPAGNLYGTTGSGGASGGGGTVYELTPKEDGYWTETVLHSFGYSAHVTVPGGFSPNAGLTFDASGNLYGTTADGGGPLPHGYGGSGTVFRLAPAADGKWKHTVLFVFGADGGDYDPNSNLVFDSAGNLYGTTQSGLYPSGGIVFEVTPTEEGQWKETTLHSFIATGIGDGDMPTGVTFDAAGNLYGSTISGSAVSGYFAGTVFELTPAAGGVWTETILYSFLNKAEPGDDPTGGVILDTAGNLYGTTYYGGVHNKGMVYELTPNGGGDWAETILHSFYTDATGGKHPAAGLVFDTKGNLYGTTSSGGTYDGGELFEFTPDGSGGWTKTVLHDFGLGTDGVRPQSALVIDAAGNLYGTTSSGGTHGKGTVFEITP